MFTCPFATTFNFLKSRDAPKVQLVAVNVRAAVHICARVNASSTMKQCIVTFSAIQYARVCLL